MLTSTCHCGAVRLVVPRRPRQLTNCNCSICRRYGTLWAYYKASTVQVICKAGATESYTWGDKRLKFVRCKSCGVVMQWLPVRPTDDSRMGVNARNFVPTDIESVRIRRLDGASTWKYLD